MSNENENQDVDLELYKEIWDTMISMTTLWKGHSSEELTNDELDSMQFELLKNYNINNMANLAILFAQQLADAMDQIEILTGNDQFFREYCQQAKLAR